VFAAISSGFTAIIYRPFYNGLVFIIDILPSHDVGVAVVISTIIVRFILFPLSRRAVQAQLAMKKISPEIEALKKKHKDNSPSKAAPFSISTRNAAYIRSPASYLF
jgi:YidC/Oxa1 family membrane protein insertase